ncbi:MAG: T9SS type A sorting domain-containing protein, partial [Candidatus Symbiothrix sp.]|nr:T9SS type A sorting domain-containing protein [Candidatus Symbiothrix sp.]
DRFLLRITSNVTGMEEVSRSIYIYSQGSDIRVISGSPIKSVMAYNLQGAMVRVSHTDVVRDLAPGIYLVRVITETDSKAAKVIVKN